MKLHEVGEEVKSGSNWVLFKKLCVLLKMQPDFQGADFDGDEAIGDAIAILKDKLHDANNASNIVYTLGNIRSSLQGEIHQLHHDGEALTGAFKFTPPAWFKEALDASTLISKKAKVMRDHITAVIEIYDALGVAMTTFDDNKGSAEWKSHGGVVRAAFKKMGIL